MRIFRRRSEEKRRGRMGTIIDFALFPVILFLLIYFFIIVPFFRGSSPAVKQKSSTSFSIMELFQFFHIGAFELIGLIVILSYLAYLRFRKSKEEEEE